MSKHTSADYCPKCDSAKGSGRCKACQAYSNKRAAHDKRLRAAAPGMFEALSDALEALYNVPEVGEIYDVQHSHTHALMCHDLGALIAEIEGERKGDE